MKQAAGHVVIVGGGLSGLTTAYRLQQGADGPAAPLRVTVLEQANRPGGKLDTEHFGGFTIEHGPDIFLARKPWGIQLCHDLGLSDHVLPTNPAHAGSFIQQRGRLHPLPAGFSGLVPTRLGPLLRTRLLTLPGKARLALEAFIPPRTAHGDEPLGAFFRRRLGREAYTRLIHPLLSGIYGGDIDTISLQATFPQFHKMERTHGSLIRGAIARKKTAPPAPGPAFVSLRDGVATLPRTLADRLGAVVQTGQAVTAVEALPDGYRVHRAGCTPLRADAVVLTGAAYQSAALVQDQHPALAELLNGIPYNSSMVVTVAFPREAVPHPLDGYGYLIPAGEGKAVRACTWSSSKLAGRAPAGQVLLRAFLGRSPDDPWLAAPDADVLACVAEELRATLGITAAPLFYRVRRWLRAQPAYVLGHPERLARIAAALHTQPGLFLTGAAYRGVGIPDCIHQAGLTAQAVADYLHQKTVPC